MVRVAIPIARVNDTNAARAFFLSTTELVVSSIILDVEDIIIILDVVVISTITLSRRPHHRHHQHSAHLHDPHSQTRPIRSTHQSCPKSQDPSRVGLYHQDSAVATVLIHFRRRRHCRLVTNYELQELQARC